MDKFLNIMRLDGYEDDEDPYYDYDDKEEYEEKKPTKKISSRSERDDSYYDEEEPVSTRAARPKTTRNSKVVPMRTTTRNGMEVCVIKPSTVEDAREISDTLLSGRAVVLNLEGLQVNIAQRIIDFTSGSCYSINGNLQKVSNYIFVITPEAVEISGDFQDLLNASGGFDVAAFQTER